MTPNKAVVMTPDSHKHYHINNTHQSDQQKERQCLICQDITVNCVLSLTDRVFTFSFHSVDSVLSTAAMLILPPALPLPPPSPSCPVGCDDALTGFASVLRGAGISVLWRPVLVQE